MEDFKVFAKVFFIWGNGGKCHHYILPNTCKNYEFLDGGGFQLMNDPDWEKLETEYNRNYDPYDHKEIEGEEDDRSENEGDSSE